MWALVEVGVLFCGPLSRGEVDRGAVNTYIFTNVFQLYYSIVGFLVGVGVLCCGSLSRKYIDRGTCGVASCEGVRGTTYRPELKSLIDLLYDFLSGAVKTCIYTNASGQCYCLRTRW